MKQALVAAILLIAFAGDAARSFTLAPTSSCPMCRKECNCCPKGSRSAGLISVRPCGAPLSQTFFTPQAADRLALLPAGHDLRPASRATPIRDEIASAPSSYSPAPPAPPPRASL